MRRALSILAIAASALLASACTSSGHGHSVSISSGAQTPTSTSASSSAVIPTPTSSISATSSAQQWSKSVAAQNAKTIVTAAQNALTALTKVPGNATIEQAKQSLASLASADQSAIGQLAAGAWPTSVRSKVNVYIAALDAERRALQDILSKKTVAEMQADTAGITAALAQVQLAGQNLTDALK